MHNMDTDFHAVQSFDAVVQFYYTHCVIHSIDYDLRIRFCFAFSYRAIVSHTGSQKKQNAESEEFRII